MELLGQLEADIGDLLTSSVVNNAICEGRNLTPRGSKICFWQYSESERPLTRPMTSPAQSMSACVSQLLVTPRVVMRSSLVPYSQTSPGYTVHAVKIYTYDEGRRTSLTRGKSNSPARVPANSSGPPRASQNFFNLWLKNVYLHQAPSQHSKRTRIDGKHTRNQRCGIEACAW